MADPVKDFVYYADKAEYHLQRTATTLDATKLHLARAEVYARLAASASAPDPAAQPVELHDAACPCLKK